MTLFAANGYATVSMQQIADAAGITKATLYHHFRDKEQLFVAAMSERYAAWQTTLSETILGTSSFRDVLIRFAEAYVSVEHADLNRLFSDFKQHVSAEAQEQFWNEFQRPWTYLQGPIGDGITRGELRDVDPVLASRLIVSAVLGPIQMARLTTDGPAVGVEQAHQMIDLLLDGIARRD